MRATLCHRNYPHPHKVGSGASWEWVHSQQCLLQSEISICDLGQWEHGAFSKVNHSRYQAICAFCSLPGRGQRVREIMMVRLLLGGPWLIPHCKHLSNCHILFPIKMHNTYLLIKNKIRKKDVCKWRFSPPNNCSMIRVLECCLPGPD